ncbi:MAG: sensor histidine kinase [Chloroflexi bacterium]|nr:sensor histidine kinase [Chloroflexota bacterium]
MVLIFSLVGVYTLARILFHFRLWERGILTYVILAGDLAVCVALVLSTGGADSPFLLYSLLPVVTAAVFFEPALALGMAALSSLNLVLAHTVLTRLSTSFTPILQENYLSIVLLYGISCFLVAGVTYRTSLNVYRRIQSDTIVSERRRLRQEMHDNVAQVMGYLSTKTSLIKKSLSPADEKLVADIEEIHQMAAESYEGIREAIDCLNIDADGISLVDDLACYVADFSKKTGIKAEFRSPPRLAAVHPVAQLQLLRIAQEALSNVKKHAGASQVTVTIDKTPRGMEMAVRDNGRGFGPSKGGGAGLGIMEERAASINGRIALKSTQDGTEVRVSVPGG